MKNLCRAMLLGMVGIFAVALLTADSTTTRFGLTKPDVGSTNWGPKINANYDLMDQAAGINLINVFGTSNSFAAPISFLETQCADGTAASPCYSFGSETTTGLMRPSSGKMTAVVAGSTVAVFSNTGVSIYGTTTNNSASAGFVGELVTSYNSSNPSFTTSTQWDDLTSISLTGGDWDAWISAEGSSGNATLIEIGISTESGNAFSTQARGSNSTFIYVSSNTPAAGFGGYLQIPVSIAASKTYYFKRSATYASSAPSCRGTISARRRH